MLRPEEREEALRLAWKVFAEYESPGYTPEGTEEFRKTLENEEYLSGLRYYGAFDGEKLVGVLAIREERSHICFFFVDGEYHRRGIGTALFRRMREDFSGRITLNSSPYGLPFYKALGFAGTDGEQTMNGIRFTPMEYGAEGTEDDRALIRFWDGVFSREDPEEAEAVDPESWKEMAPSEKLFRAAASLGTKEKVLDYGCGSGWAAVIAAKSGCPDVTAADPAPGAVKAARECAETFGAPDRVRAVCGGTGWLKAVPDDTYDGVFCSNVLDVVPPETAEILIRELARAAAPGADVIIGLNYYLSPRKAEERGMTLEEGNRLYVDGVLRLVSRTDGEWAEAFSPWFGVERLEHFAWPGETAETRRLFHLRKEGN